MGLKVPTFDLVVIVCVGLGPVVTEGFSEVAGIGWLFVVTWSREGAELAGKGILGVVCGTSIGNEVVLWTGEKFGSICVIGTCVDE